MAVYDQVKQALQDILAPELQALKAEIRRLDEHFGFVERRLDDVGRRLDEVEKRVHERMEGLRVEFLAEIRRLDGRLGALDEKFESLKHEIRTVLEIKERLAALEAKVGITRS